jgi:hypothetical protein
VGDNKLRPVDVRVLAATNADLQQKVKDGTFRKDSIPAQVVTIELPRGARRYRTSSCSASTFRNTSASCTARTSSRSPATRSWRSCNTIGPQRGALRNAVESDDRAREGQHPDAGTCRRDMGADALDHDGWVPAAAPGERSSETTSAWPLELCGGNRQKRQCRWTSRREPLDRKIQGIRRFDCRLSGGVSLGR